MMKTRRGTVIMVLIGLVICVAIVGVGVVAWFFISVFDSAPSDEVTASREFDEVRRRLGEAQPIIEIREGNAILTREPPAAAPTRELQRVHILTWEPEDEELSRITLPWWLMRMRSGSFDISTEAGSGFNVSRITITPEHIERYGPALVLSHTEPDGRRVLVWTE